MMPKVVAKKFLQINPIDAPVITIFLSAHLSRVLVHYLEDPYLHRAADIAKMCLEKGDLTNLVPKLLAQ